jgi:hypothetical protein
LVLFLAGCSTDVQFCVIDATTASVLPGVKVKVRRVTSLTYFERKPNEREVGVTDAHGLITVKLTTNDEVYFCTNGYYWAVAALSAADKATIASPFPPTGTPWVSPRQVTTNRTGQVKVALLPLPGRL